MPVHKIRTAKLQRGARANAVIKEIMIGNMREIGCTLRLDRCRYQPDLPVTVEILMEAASRAIARAEFVPDT